MAKQAIADVESLRLLYEFDSRIPSQALATHVLVANSLRANGVPDWISCLRDAKPIVEHLESRSRTDWEDYFLAAYYYDLGQEGVLDGGRDMALNAYEDAAVDAEGNLHDYASCYYIALASELGVRPNPKVKHAIEASATSVYGWRGLGLSYALSGNKTEARKSAEALVHRDSIDARLFAAEILMMSGLRDAAANILNDLASEVNASETHDASKWYRQEVLKFYRAQLGDGDYTPEQLLQSAEMSEYPRANLSFAYWAIAIASWEADSGTDDTDCVQSLKLCEAQRQISFPQLPWSRALIAWIEGKESH